MGIRSVAARAAAVGMTLVAAAGITTATAEPASAHYSQCPADQFCYWDHSSYEGAFGYFRGSVSNVGDRMNDRMTSYWNRTNYWISVYEHSNYRECMLTIPPGGSSAAVAPQFNDKMTSFRLGAC
ncbi:peptidase inhibitor family I36 protein [Streptomyces synnematoformans]|uniref:Peptidase inhibitor family I36 n=1 Tax=Streptomyces synnematoformans TaxID=415721 RepID=A0ABP5L6D9_9ACTN